MPETTGSVTVEITVFDAAKIDALLAKIAADARVVAVHTLAR